MSRDLLIILGAMAWSLVALVAGIHLILGDLVVPLGMAAIAVGWIGFRRLHPARVAATVPTRRS